jgi:hypothetical protein
MLQGKKVAAFQKLIWLRDGAEPGVVAFKPYIVKNKISGWKL